jgi:exopolyphosphatase/pppGpp-phosphohydrolase
MLIFRLAVLFNRKRLDGDMPEVALARTKSGFELRLYADWLAENPLTSAALQNEMACWQEAGISLTLEGVV